MSFWRQAGWVVLACVTLWLALGAFGRWVQGRAATRGPAAAPPAVLAPEGRATMSPVPAAVPAWDDRGLPVGERPPSPAVRGREIVTAVGAVTKCQGGGRTSYVQDGRCPPGQQAVLLQLPALSQADRHPVEARPRAGREPVGREDVREPRRTAQDAPGVARPDRRDLRIRDCAGWARQIEAIDARARQPQSAATQDSLRAQRARLRERQAAAGC